MGQEGHSGLESAGALIGGNIAPASRRWRPWVSGRFGIYAGSPSKPIPTSEMRELPPELPPGLAWSILVRPSWQDFKIDGKPLFETCREYLNQAQALTSQARALAEKVHGARKLPPSDM